MKHKNVSPNSTRAVIAPNTSSNQTPATNLFQTTRIMAHGLSQYIIDRVYFLGVFQQRQNDDGAAAVDSKPVVVWNQYSRRRIVDTTTAMRNYYEVLTNRRTNEPGRSSSYSTVFSLEGCRWMIHTPGTTKDDDDKNDRLLTTFVVVTNPMYPLPLAAACLRDLLRLFIREQEQRNKVDGVRRSIIGAGEGTTTRSRPQRLSCWIATMTSCRTNHGARLRQQQSRLDDLFFTYARMSTTTKTAIPPDTASTIGYNGARYLRRSASSNERTKSTGMAVELV
jgi:hypothetical protein